MSKHTFALGKRRRKKRKGPFSAMSWIEHGLLLAFFPFSQSKTNPIQPVVKRGILVHSYSIKLLCVYLFFIFCHIKACQDRACLVNSRNKKTVEG